MTKLCLCREVLEKLLLTRKMIVSDIAHIVDVSHDDIVIENIDTLFALSLFTSLPEKEFIAAHYRHRRRNDRGVTIARKDSLYSRIKGGYEKGGYHYRHVLTTPYDSDLLVLRTTPLSSKQQATLNTGHLVKELVYVLSGRVGIVWLNRTGKKRYTEMNQGDSVFIQSWVPHAFYTLTPESQILAVDYA